jgi:hypothetical protein
VHAVPPEGVAMKSVECLQLRGGDFRLVLGRNVHGICDEAPRMSFDM